MAEVDAKKLFSKSILGLYKPNADISSLESFFASEDYIKNVLPLFIKVEAQLRESWQGFNTPEVRILPFTDFSPSTSLLTNVAPDGGRITPAADTAPTSSKEKTDLQTNLKPVASNGIDSVDAAILAHSDDLSLRGDANIPASTTTTEAMLAATDCARPVPIDQANPLSTPKLAAPMPQQTKTTLIKLEFTLPNASVGQSYSHQLLPTTPVSGLVVKEVRVAEDFGLRFDSSSNCLVGTPTKSGEFQLEIWFYAENTLPDLASARLIVNPDPKSLWQNLPSDRSDPYWKPDEDHQFIKGSEDWHLVAGSKRGRSHAQKGTFRDDDFFIFSQEQTGWQIAVVSDGAGSAKYSRRGSAIICKDGGEHLERALAGDAGTDLIAAVEAWQSDLQTSEDAENQKRLIKKQLYVTLGYAAHFALTRIREECERRADLGGTVKDYSSTILIGITKRFSQGVFCASFSIGDGAIGVMQKDGTPELLCEPDGGDFSGQTRFLSQDTVTQEELLKRVKFSLVRDFAGMYLMTDGISDPYFQTDKGLEMPERWAQLLQDVETEALLSQRNPESGQRLVTWLDFWSKGEHDDRTLAVIY